MADSYLRRILQFVFDRGSAKKAEGEAKASLGKIEKDASRLEAFFKRLGGIVAAAFGVRALINFGREAIRQASEAEAVWSELQNTVENTGESFQALEGDLRNLSSAFQEATVHSDEDYAQSLNRLIALTGDVSASIQNMGLVANVAAKFFRGELAPAVELVGKVMNGQTTALRRMGIVVESAQEGLEILAERSFGAAEARAATFGGRIQQLNNLWGEFQEQLGNVLISAEGTTGGLELIREALIQATDWVERNQDALRSWVTGAIKYSIIFLDALVRTIMGLAELLAGPMVIGIATVVRAWGFFGKGLATAIEGLAAFLDLLPGEQGFVERMKAFSESLRENATALSEWGKAKQEAGLGLIVSGAKRFAEPIVDFSGTGPGRRRRAAGAASLFDTGAPAMGKNAVTDATDEVKDALEDYAKAMRGIHLLHGVLGKDFDALGAEIEATEKVIKRLAAAGWDASNPKMQEFLTRLREITKAAKEQAALQTLEKTLGAIERVGDSLGSTFDALEAEAGALEQAIGDLAEAGFDQADPRMQQFAERLREIKREMAERNAFRDYEISVVRQGELLLALGQQFDEFGRKIDPVTTAMAGLEAEAETLRNIITDLVNQGFDAGDPILAEYIARLRELDAAIAKNRAGLEATAQAAELFGAAVGAAFAGSIGPFAAGKARENLIEAAEQTARGIGALLNPFTAPKAAGHFLLAAKHTAIAGAWKALSSAFGGSGGGGAGGGGGGLAGGRGASGGAAAQAEPAPTEVHLHLGGHLSAMDIELQAVTLGALQESRERVGQNVKVRVHNDGKAQSGTVKGRRP